MPGSVGVYPNFRYVITGRDSSLLLRLLFFLTAALLAQPGVADRFYAAKLTPRNIDRMPPGGMDAIGGVGDWFLTDGTLCAVITGEQHPTYLSPHGAALVDLWHCALANDQWSVAHTQLNMRQDRIPVTSGISAGFDAGGAWIETRGTLQGLEAVVRYQLSGTSPRHLKVETVITRGDSGKPMGMLGALILHPNGSLTPFTVDSLDGSGTLGFNQPTVDTTDWRSVLSAVTGADMQVLLGTRHAAQPISYAVRMVGAWRRDATGRERSGRERPVHTFLISGPTFSMFGAFSRPFPGFWPRTPGPVSFALGRLFDLGVGDSLVFHQRIYASPRADAAALLDNIYNGPVLRGRLDTKNASITARDVAGDDLNFARPDEQGRFSLRLPRDTAASPLVRTPWSENTLSIAAQPGGTDLGRLATGAPGVLALPTGGAMSLLFLGDDGPPVFHEELTGARVGGERRLGGAESYRLNLSGTDHDPPEVHLPPGTYRVLASRGPEYTVTEATVQVPAGEYRQLDIAPPRRAVSTPGLISADLHVHSGVSFDSSLTPRQRVVDFAAQGAEILATTEHNITWDLGSTIEAMGLEKQILSLPGVEITSMVRSTAAPTTIGHSNVFPVQVNPAAFAGGTLRFEQRRLGEVIASYKGRFPNSVFQLNHPRSLIDDEALAFFNHLSQGRAFDPGRPLSEPPNNVLLQSQPGSDYRDIDFDAMELLNGNSMALYELVRADWFALLRQGIYKVATANSDSHSSHELVAYPRSMIAVENDTVTGVGAADIAAAIRRGELYGTTGPIIEVDVDGTGPGGVHRGASGTLTIRIEGAPWVTVNEVRIWLNGERWRTLPARTGSVVAHDVTFSRDSFLFVEVVGEPSAIYRTVAPGFTPFAFANPIFIDTEGDGYHAPGAVLAR